MSSQADVYTGACTYGRPYIQTPVYTDARIYGRPYIQTSVYTGIRVYGRPYIRAPESLRNLLETLGGAKFLKETQTLKENYEFLIRLRGCNQPSSSRVCSHRRDFHTNT